MSPTTIARGASSLAIALLLAGLAACNERPTDPVAPNQVASLEPSMATAAAVAGPCDISKAVSWMGYMHAPAGNAALGVDPVTSNLLATRVGPSGRDGICSSFGVGVNGIRLGIEAHDGSGMDNAASFGTIVQSRGPDTMFFARQLESFEWDLDYDGQYDQVVTYRGSGAPVLVQYLLDGQVVGQMVVPVARKGPFKGWHVVGGFFDIFVDVNSDEATSQTLEIGFPTQALNSHLGAYPPGNFNALRVVDNNNPAPAMITRSIVTTTGVGRRGVIGLTGLQTW